jgi:hypothetical protein
MINDWILEELPKPAPIWARAPKSRVGGPGSRRAAVARASGQRGQESGGFGGDGAWGRTGPLGRWLAGNNNG